MSACWLSEFHWAEGAVEGTMNGLDTSGPCGNKASDNTATG